MFVLETSARWFRPRILGSTFKTEQEGIAYVRGYFDAEGGVPHCLAAPLYVQFVQKNKASLEGVKVILERLQIECGVIHNPSRRVDPDYWRFFVRRSAHERFIHVVGSWHPRKATLLANRVKI